MDLSLADQRAIVTGGTGGIGIAIARQLALEGVRTAVCSRSLDRATDAIASLDLGGDAELAVHHLRRRRPQAGGRRHRLRSQGRGAQAISYTTDEHHEAVEQFLRP